MRFEQVVYRYGEKTALDGITCGLEPGRLYALIGPNGSGKTTWLKVAAGLLAPAAGRVLVDEKDLRAMHPRQRARHISYMPQVRQPAAMTVSELVACGRFPYLGFGGALNAHDLRQVEDAIDRTGIGHFRDRHMGELSGGEQQRVYLAMMLAQQTDVLLLDEPANHLDPAGQLALTALLADIAHAGKTVLMTVHNLPLALQSCDVLLLLDHGRLRAQGSPDDPACIREMEQAFAVSLYRTQPGWVVLPGQAGDNIFA